MTKACAELVGQLCRLRLIWVSFHQRKNPVDGFYIRMEWLKSCSSIAEDGILRKDTSIGEFKTLFMFFLQEEICLGVSNVSSLK